MPTAPPASDFIYTLEFKVRDYECDLQGIVNNSVYQNYLEHARHEFFHTQGFSFAKLAQDGVHLVVTRAELDYKKPLRSGDHFWVGVKLEQKGATRGIFEQQIFRSKDNALVLNGVFTWAAITPEGKPMKNHFIFEQLTL